MHRWREQPPLIVDRAEGFDLIDPKGKRYLDGVSSLWCNVHGHRHPHLDQAIRDQLDRAAHTTLLGLASPPSIELAARLVDLVNARLDPNNTQPNCRLERVFYTDAGATAVEVALKMAVGYWAHRGHPRKHRLIALGGAYHGDTAGSMSVGFSPRFHGPFESMTFEVQRIAAPDPLRSPAARDQPCPADGCATCTHLAHAPTPTDPLPGALPGAGALPGNRVWPSECPRKQRAILNHAEQELRAALTQDDGRVAAVVVEPVMQGAAGMIAQPPGFLRMVRALCDAHGALLICDEVATGFGRTGTLFACEHENVTPDILCLAKGLTGGYLPLAVTMCTAEVEAAFADPQGDNRLYHGHTYTGNALGCAVALASLDLWEPHPRKSDDASIGLLPEAQRAWSPPDLLRHIEASANLLADKLNALRGCPAVLDVRQRGLMIGVELAPSPKAPDAPESPDVTGLPAAPNSPAQHVCLALLEQGVWLRPLGDVVILMPPPAMGHDDLARMCDAVVEQILKLC
ncbi:MAG: aminotransferase class III-fold pyridoxal phosphate-dependent enzyme [Planctomycetota bacterium]